MNHYQRIVSYVYRYEQQEKKENAGYVRVERQGDKARLTVGLQKKILRDPVVYALYGRETGKSRQRLGSLKPQNNGWNCCIPLAWSVLADAEGILISQSQGDQYVTQWTENGVDWVGQDETEEPRTGKAQTRNPQIDQTDQTEQTEQTEQREQTDQRIDRAKRW